MRAKFSDVLMGTVEMLNNNNDGRATIFVLNNFPNCITGNIFTVTIRNEALYFDIRDCFSIAKFIFVFSGVVLESGVSLFSLTCGPPSSGGFNSPAPLGANSQQQNRDVTRAAY